MRVHVFLASACAALCAYLLVASRHATAATFCPDLERAVAAAKQSAFKSWMGKRDPDIENTWASTATLSFPQYGGEIDCDIEEDEVRRSQRTLQCMAMEPRAARISGQCALPQERVSQVFSELEQCVRGRFPSARIRKDGPDRSRFAGFTASELAQTSDGFAVEFVTDVFRPKKGEQCPLWVWKVTLQ
jgi:hypothetical protein